MPIAAVLLLMAALVAVFHDHQTAPRLPSYHFGYVLKRAPNAGLALVHATVFQGHSRTYMTLPRSVRLTEAQFRRGAQWVAVPVAADGPYWQIQGRASMWRFQTTAGLLWAARTLRQKHPRPKPSPLAIKPVHVVLSLPVTPLVATPNGVSRNSGAQDYRGPYILPFAPGSARLGSVARQEITRLIGAARTTLWIHLSGSASHQSGARLAVRRCAAVAAFMVRDGIPPDRFTVAPQNIDSNGRWVELALSPSHHPYHHRGLK